jgi:hypothetical protein
VETLPYIEGGYHCSPHSQPVAPWIVHRQNGRGGTAWVQIAAFLVMLYVLVIQNSMSGTLQALISISGRTFMSLFETLGSRLIRNRNLIIYDATHYICGHAEFQSSI